MRFLLTTLLLALHAFGQVPPRTDLVMVLETSPGTEQAIALLNRKALLDGDRAAVITASGRSSRVLQPLSEDREKLATAIQRAGVRIGGSVGRAQINPAWTVNLAAGILGACEELQANGKNDNQPAILIVFGSEDPGLSMQMPVIRSAVSSAKAKVYAVFVNRYAGERPSSPLGAIRLPATASTSSLVEELTSASGGKIYRGGWDLREILKEIRKP